MRCSVQSVPVAWARSIALATRRLERGVAIKILPARLSDDPVALARFEREAKAVAALSHPSILAIFDIGTADGISYAVTELLEGETLRARLADGRAVRP